MHDEQLPAKILGNRYLFKLNVIHLGNLSIVQGKKELGSSHKYIIKVILSVFLCPYPKTGHIKVN